MLLEEVKNVYHTNINLLRAREFRNLPFINDSIGGGIVCSSLVILPNRRYHDSGYRTMDFVACKEGCPLGRVAGNSDVLHIAGISGDNNEWRNSGYSALNSLLIHRVPWSIDCLARSGYLNLFAHDHNLRLGGSFSSFEVIAKPIM